MSTEVEIEVRLDEAEARRKIAEAETRSKASRREAEDLRRTSRNSRGALPGGSGAAQEAVAGALVVGLIATLAAEVVIEAVDEFLDASGLDEILSTIARLRELAKRWGL